MSFRFFIYFGKISVAILFSIVLGTFFFRPKGVMASVGTAAHVVFFILGVIGAVMGILLACGKLRMRCPFCGRSGPILADRSLGLAMRCEECELVRCSGLLGLRIVREPWPWDEEDDEETDRTDGRDG